MSQCGCTDDDHRVREAILVPSMLLGEKTIVVYDPNRPARAEAIVGQTMRVAIERLQPGTFMTQRTLPSDVHAARNFAFVAFTGPAYDDLAAFLANPSARAYIAQAAEEHLYTLEATGALPPDVLIIDAIDASPHEALSAADLECGPAPHKMVDVAMAHRSGYAQRPFIFSARLVPPEKGARSTLPDT